MYLSPSSGLVKPPWMYNLIILISTLAFFLLPMLVISILYLLIGLRLHRERVMTVVDTRCSFGPESLSTSHKQKLSKRNLQITKMLCRWHFSHVFSKLLWSGKLNLNWLCVCVCKCLNPWISYFFSALSFLVCRMPVIGLTSWISTCVGIWWVYTVSVGASICLLSIYLSFT